MLLRQAFNFKSRKLLLAAAYFSYFATYFVPIIHIDEGAAATWARYAFSGDLYVHYPDHKLPFLFQFFWLLSLGARSLVAMRFLLPLWIFFGGVLLEKILNRW